MAEPEGTLTAAQHEILDVIWNSKGQGATVSEIWQAISEHREVTRTTVLNQVERLERRGWLRRKKGPAGYRYVVTKDREAAACGLAEEFVDSFFGGSASDLVMSLLGSKKLKATDIARLREVLDSQESKRSRKK